MKTFLLILSLLSFHQVIRAADLAGTEVGAWWDTKAPAGGKRTAGWVKVRFYTDNTCLAEYIWNDILIANGVGTWKESRLYPNRRSVTITSPSFVAKGSLNVSTGRFTATYTGGGYTGQIQCSWDSNRPHLPPSP